GAARVSPPSARRAARRLTNDSRASDRSPTEPVMKYAPAFRAMVSTAATIDSQANRVRDRGLSIPGVYWHSARQPPISRPAALSSRCAVRIADAAPTKGYLGIDESQTLV